MVCPEIDSMAAIKLTFKKKKFLVCYNLQNLYASTTIALLLNTVDMVDGNQLQYTLNVRLYKRRMVTSLYYSVYYGRIDFKAGFDWAYTLT